MKTQPLESTSKDNTSESHESGELIIPSSANVNVERSTAESKPFEPSDTYISQNWRKLSESNFGKLKSSQNNVANVLFQDRKSNDPHFESVTNTSDLRAMGSSSSSDSREEGLITYLRTTQERQTKRNEKENESETKMGESNRKGLKSNEFCLDGWSDSTKDSSFGIPGSNGGAISDSMASSSDKVGSSRSRPTVPDSPLSWSSRDWDRESSRQHRSYDRIRDHHRDRDNTKRDPYENNRRMHSNRDRRSEYDAEYDRDRGRRDRDRDKGKDRRDRETSRDNARNRVRDRDRDASRDRDIDADLRRKREKERERGSDPKTAGKQVGESKPENSSVSEEGVHRQVGQSSSGVGTTSHSSTAMATVTSTHSNVTRNTCSLPMALMGTNASRSPRQRHGQRSRRYRHDDSSSSPSSPSTRSPPYPPSPPSPRSPRSSQPRSPSPHRRRSRRSVSRDRRPRSRSTSPSFRRSPRRLDSDPLGKSRVSSHSAFHSRWKPLNDGLNNHKSESQELASTILQVSAKTDGLVRASSLISTANLGPDDNTCNWNKEMRVDSAREGKEGKEENGGGESKVKECEGVGEQSTKEDGEMKGVALNNPDEGKGRGDVEGRRDKEGGGGGGKRKNGEVNELTVETMSSSSSGSDMEIDDVSSSGTRNSGGGENKNAQSAVLEYPQDSDHYHLHHHYPHPHPHPHPHHHHHHHHPHHPHHHHHHQQGQSHQEQIPDLVPTSSSTLSLSRHSPPTSQPSLPPPLPSVGKATNRKGWGERKDLSEVNDALRKMTTRTTTITATTTSTTEAVASLPLPPSQAPPDALSAAPNTPRSQIPTQKGLSSSSLPVHQPISLSSLSLMIQLPSSSFPSSSSASLLSSLAHPITTPTVAPSYTIPNPSSQPTLGQLSLTAGLWASNIATSSLSSLPLSISPPSGISSIPSISSTPSLSSALPPPALSSTLPVSFPPFSLAPATIPPPRFSRGFGKTQRLKTQAPSTGGAIVAATNMPPPPLLTETNGPDASTMTSPSPLPSSPLFEPSLKSASSSVFKTEEQVPDELPVLTTAKQNSKEGVVIRREEEQEDGRLPCLIDSPPTSIPPHGRSHASTKAEGEWRSIKPFEERCDDLSGLVAVEMLQISSMMRASTCAHPPGDEASIHMKRDHLMKEARDFKHQADRERTAAAENGPLGRVLGAWTLRTLVLYLRSCLRFFECAHQCELEATSESARRAARLLHDMCGMLSRVQDGARDLRLSLHRLTIGNSGRGNSGGGNGRSGSMVKGSCSEDQGMRQNLALSLVMTLAMKLQALARTRWLLLNEAQLNEAIRRIEISLKQHQQDKGLGAKRSKGDSGNGGEEEAEGKGISNLSRTNVNGANNNGSNAGAANPMTASAITTSKNTTSSLPISIMNHNNSVPIFNNSITSSLSNEDENILLTGSQVTAAQIAAESIEHFAKASELWREVSLEETALASTAAAAGEKDALIAAAQVAAMGFEGGAWSLTGSVRIAERVMEVVVERLAVKET
eukprot:CAMPEP_0175087964 /NCGR_PEP_ID=MMETSP0052_2-20121109/30126_1 /TAXON_ID=51329 ORGANISM="Polytomella parva, Strain SAG 63-3" /NCGR_SAMPLE_ID=MMETSP0052_2 /ASSEMBLY_ACC=CAM_ASM_000194 /LENGTH=1503 /DNA_ID=CAMNT_0016360375 /DNA_START=317 /DNA_END=4829 /DNA_ORIENTATION=+